MMDKEVTYITEEKRKSLEKELEDLKGPQRKEILASLKYAKSLGDLSENAEYHQAREDQAKLEERIARVEQILQSSEVVSRGSKDTIGIGSTVKVHKEGGDKDLTYIVVGSEESDMKAGKISNKSPFGEALFGKKKGDSISFRTPGGLANYKIISIS